MSKAIYPSKYTDRKVTDAQYLTDEICERIARKEGKVLPYKYWNLSEWNNIYRRQIAAANKLLKDTDCLYIMSYLRSKRGQQIYSLGLRKEILAGANQFVVAHAVSNPHLSYEDNLLPDLIEEEIEQSSGESKTSMWEKL